MKKETAKEYEPYPKRNQRNMSLAIINKKPNSSKACAIMNALNILTPLSLNTVKSLLAQGVSKVTVVYDSNDQMSKEFLRSSFKD